MRVIIPCISLLSAGLVLAVVPISSIKRVSNLPTLPNRFIVEVEKVSEIPRGSLATFKPHENLYTALKGRGVKFDVDKEFDSPGLFVGAAVTLSDPQDANELQNIPGVKAVRPIRKIARPEPVFSHVVSAHNDRAVPPDSESTHIMTGVDKLHAEGITGKGVKIGIIDTGIDYTHPSLGGGFGPGHKVVGGYDFVGDFYDGSNTPVPDNDPLDQCSGHGTHVAGIIGADPGNKFNISGVAYSASISAYRIFGCFGGFVTDDIIVEALLLGVKDQQDILTLSLAGADGWTESVASVVASRIAATGKIVTIAAGNDGTWGSWYPSSPGNGIDVISVASVDNIVVPIQKAMVNGVAHSPITYFRLFPLAVTEALPIYATSNDTTIADDACRSLPDSTPDLSPFLVIVRRGSCTFAQKLENIAAKGAKVALIYDNGSGFNAISVGDFTASLIQKADGEFLVSQFVEGIPVTITFPETGSSTNFDSPTGGLISSFTSYGPTNDFFFKPAIAAPGGNILSTWPISLGGFAVLSGTSMATPFLAGSSALLFSVKGKSADVGRTARTLFETTAKMVPSTDTDGDPLQTVTQQGAGLINAFNAIHTTTIVSPGEFILNDTTHYKNPQKLVVKNVGKQAKKYTLSHVPAGTAITVTPGTIFAAMGPVPLTADYAAVTFSSNSFTVGPGQSETIMVWVTPPQGVDASTFPVFSGFIQITSNGENLHVTYMGLAASLKDKQVVDNTDDFFGFQIPALINAFNMVQTGPTNYTFVGHDFPTLLIRLVFGTPAAYVDVVDSNIKLLTTLNRPVESEPFLTVPHSYPNSSFAQVKILGRLAEFHFVSRHDNSPSNDGYSTIAFERPMFANGTLIPNGLYKILVRALRVTGDPTKEEDYESWLSPTWGVAV